MSNEYISNLSYGIAKYIHGFFFLFEKNNLKQYENV